MRSPQLLVQRPAVVENNMFLLIFRDPEVLPKTTEKLAFKNTEKENTLVGISQIGVDRGAVVISMKGILD